MAIKSDMEDVEDENEVADAITSVSHSNSPLVGLRLTWQGFLYLDADGSQCSWGSILRAPMPAVLSILQEQVAFAETVESLCVPHDLWAIMCRTYVFPRLVRLRLET